MDTGRLGFAQWLLDRNIAWIAAAEAKVGFVVAIDTAMLAGLATAYSDANEVGCLGVTATIAAALLTIASVVCAALAVFSRTNGPPESLLYFGRIAERGWEEYRLDLQDVSDTRLLDDFARQIHRNAEIAKEKFLWVGRSMRLAFGAGAAWVIAITVLIRL